MAQSQRRGYADDENDTSNPHKAVFLSLYFQFIYFVGNGSVFFREGSLVMQVCAVVFIAEDLGLTGRLVSASSLFSAFVACWVG